MNVLMNTGWQFLKKVKLCLSDDLVVLLPGIYPRHMEAYVHTKTCPQLFIAAIWNSWKLETIQCSPTDEWINKLWYIYTTGYYLAVERNNLWTCTTTFTNLIIIILSERNQTKKITCCITPFISNYRKCKLLYSNRNHISGYLERGSRRKGLQRDMKKLWGGVMNLFIILSVVTSSGVHIYLKIYQAVHINYE